MKHACELCGFYDERDKSLDYNRYSFSKRRVVWLCCICDRKVKRGKIRI